MAGADFEDFDLAQIDQLLDCPLDGSDRHAREFGNLGLRRKTCLRVSTMIIHMRGENGQDSPHTQPRLRMLADGLQDRVRIALYGCAGFLGVVILSCTFFCVQFFCAVPGTSRDGVFFWRTVVAGTVRERIPRIFPAILGTFGACSAHLRTGISIVGTMKCFVIKGVDGAAGENRTLDLSLTKGVLYL